MRKILILLLMFLFSLVTFTLVSYMNFPEVSLPNTDLLFSQDNLQTAIDSASPGDTIHVPEGTFQGSIAINKPLRLIGAGVKKTVIDGYGETVISVTAENVTVAGFTIQNGHHGIRMVDSTNVVITNNTIANNEYGIVIWNAPYTGRNGKYVTVHSNNLTNNGNGVYIVDSSNVIVHSNSIKSASCGVFMWQSPRKSPLGILLGEITVISNDIGDGDVGIYCYGSCPLIQRNSLIGNRMYSIHLRLVSDSTIQNNTIVGSERGIYSEFSSNLLAKDNCLLHHEVGMLLDSSENNMISNCSFSGNGYGIMIETSSFRRLSSGNRIIENVLTSNQGGIYIHMSRENNIQFNEVSNNSVFGVLLKSSRSNWIMHSNVSGNSEGIHLVSSWENFIVHNILLRNERGVNLELSSLNKIYLNSFLDNRFQMVSLESDNFWNDDLSKGNFWGDYEGSDDGSGGRIAGDDVGDTLLPQLGVDNYPLMKPPET